VISAVNTGGRRTLLHLDRSLPSLEPVLMRAVRFSDHSAPDPSLTVGAVDALTLGYGTFPWENDDATMVRAALSIHDDKPPREGALAALSFGEIRVAVLLERTAHFQCFFETGSGPEPMQFPIVERCVASRGRAAG
jgi:hypothetical protein